VEGAVTRLVTNRVICDGGKRDDGFTCIASVGAVDRYEPMPVIRRRARERGWFWVDGQDLCPTCAMRIIRGDEA
jgi:hypothetical protein